EINNKGGNTNDSSTKNPCGMLTPRGNAAYLAITVSARKPYPVNEIATTLTHSSGKKKPTAAPMGSSTIVSCRTAVRTFIHKKDCGVSRCTQTYSVGSVHV